MSTNRPPLAERLAACTCPAERRALYAERDQLAASVERLVYHLAWKFWRRHRQLPIEDLCQGAMLGALRAAECFDPRRGLLFVTSAFYLIRQGIQQAATSAAGPVALPEYYWAGAMSEQHLADAARAKEDAQRALGAYSIDKRSSTDGTIADDLEAPCEDPADGAARREMAARVRVQLRRLPRAERMALKLRYWKGLSMAEVGRWLGYSTSGARLLEERALAFLRRELIA